MSIKITVKKNVELGTWRGLGGAITESTAYNFAKLNPKKQQELLDVYYGKNGLDYRWGRISIGSNDFCLQPYEYTKKVDLSDFSIAHDERWLLPMLKKILEKKDLELVASPWSPPRCMKFAWRQRLSGILKPWHYDAYTKYIRKWVESYARKGVKIDYLTPQNEPRAFQIWESCFYSYGAQRRLAYDYLAKGLNDTDVKILLWDHNKKELAKVADKLLGGKHLAKKRQTEKIAGLCYHWYDGTFPEQMWQVRKKYPDILMVSTEMCCGFSPYDEEDWQKDASLYYREIFNNINSGADAFIDWNILLNWQGGPSHCENYVKSPVILNSSEDDFILTPIYAALKKFTKLFPVGSKAIRCEYDSENIAAIAKKTKTGYTVIIANISDQKQEVSIRLDSQKKDFALAKFEVISFSF